MVEINVTDIVQRLNDLRFYSHTLSMKLEHEEELPDDAAPFLIDQIETAYKKAAAASLLNKADAYDDLRIWLQRSYRYYIARLALADEPWAFRFPSTSNIVRH